MLLVPISVSVNVTLETMELGVPAVVGQRWEQPGPEHI